jgi:alkylation response protein AidB-like acyl-CoA dehydrogenase
MAPTMLAGGWPGRCAGSWRTGAGLRCTGPKSTAGRPPLPCARPSSTKRCPTIALPGGDNFGVRMMGATLMIHGSDEQKRAHLPPVARGEVQWCQGYSEPESGSDLTSLSTRAVRDGDDFVINGSKIWTSMAHRADWMMLLVRTDLDAPKHRGISFFLVDLQTPGIEIRPIINMAGRHEFN